MDDGTVQPTWNVPSAGDCRAVVLTCFDWRFVEPVQQYLRAHDLDGAADLLCWPGGALDLDTSDRQRVIDAIALGCELHHPSEIILMTHRDCGWLGGSQRFDDAAAETAVLDEGLRTAGRLVRERFPDLAITLVCLEREGPRTVVDDDGSPSAA